MKYPIISQNPDIQAFYVKMRKQGTAHTLAEMLALRRGPGLVTDTTFAIGRGTLLDSCHGSEKMTKSLVEAARAQGYEPKTSDTYDPGLARFRADRLAFVPASGGRSHIKRVLEMQGRSGGGAVNVKGRGPESDPHEVAEPLAPDILNRVVKAMKATPEMARKSTGELREMATANHALETASPIRKTRK